jgi:group I intron endonuclease
MPILIYTLEHPLTGEIRYVGKTKNLLKYRLTLHLTSKDRGYRSNWVKKLKAQGLKPIIQELALVEDHEDWRDIERYWIVQLKAWGFRLTNLTHGGDGAFYKSASRKPSLQTIEKLKKIHSGNKYNLGRKMTQYTKDRLKQAKDAMSEDQIKAWSNSLKKSWINRKATEGSIKALKKLAIKNSKPIIQLTLSGVFIRKFKSSNEVEQLLGYSHTNIANVCKKRKGHYKAYGYRWEYES